MSETRALRSTWYDGKLYAAAIDRLLSGIRRYVVEHLPPGERVLDACCGTGALARSMAASGRTVVGVDLSPRNIEFARAQARAEGLSEGSVRFFAADVAAFEPDGPIDVATIVMSLHEMPPALRSPVLVHLTELADRVLIVDFAAPMRRNLAGVRNLAVEISAGREHFRAYRDYQRAGGLAPLIDGLDILRDRTIDSGTLRVLTVARG